MTHVEQGHAGRSSHRRSKRVPQVEESRVHAGAIAAMDQKIDFPHRSQRRRPVRECGQRRALQDNDRNVRIREPNERRTQQLTPGSAMNRLRGGRGV